MSSARSGFLGNRVEDAADQRVVPGCCESDRLRIGGCVRRCQAMKALLMEHQRNAQPCVLDSNTLQSIREFHHLCGPTILAWTRDMTEPILQRLFRFRLVELTLFVYEVFLRREILRMVLPS